ncbi:glycosyltransferase (plasmid) [Nostoc sp. UHCC 0302]|uniref:glycosyltransferase n=1 Tax=Nostoc sp. UHCC 0302 TaxID=3134896 RepID=UPI00311CC1BE
MKILQIITQMEAGGAQKVAMLLADALRNRGHEVEICFLYIKRPIYLDSHGVKFLLEHKPSLLDYIKIVIKLNEYLRSYQPQVLITHTHYANVLGQFVARLCGIRKRIAVQHNPVFTYPKIAALVDLTMGITGFYSANIAVSQVVVDSVVNYPIGYKKLLKKIYNGIPALKVGNSPIQVHSQWCLPENVPLLINIGRLAKQKNQAIILETLLQIPEAHLLLLGDGELRNFLENRIAELGLKERVHCLGELKSDDVLALLSIANIFIFPSLYEAMPMALLEAMSLGLPIVASDIPAMQEVLGDAGILLPANSVEEIVKAIRQVLGSSKLANHMRECSLKRAYLFSLEKMVESYEELFN